MVNRFDTFNDLNFLKSEFESMFKYCKIRRNYLLCSDILDRGGNPNVRIDSKTPTKSLKIKIDNNSITFISIVNSTESRGFFQQVMSIISKVAKDGCTVFVDKDVSKGFWNHIKIKYPQYNWIIL